jgi:hypothetical protein
MRKLFWIWIFALLTACGNDEQSCISVRNQTDSAIYIQPYSSDFADGGWIQPGWMEEFYSINCDCLDGFKYFSFYYDSLIIHLKDHEEDPIKFFKTGRTVNYDPTLNPFTNPEVWKTREEERSLPGKVFKSNYEERTVIEHYFTISTEYIKSMKTNEVKELTPSF